MALRFPIYLDNHATTPVDPRVLEAMLPYFTEKFGNPASRQHQFGWEAESAVELARKQIAELINANPREIIFTSGATESINLALKGIALAYAEKGKHIITTQIEHKATLDTCKRLEKIGFKIDYLPVDKYGVVDPDEIKKRITSETILVSVMFANNEIGTIEPIEEIGKICSEMNVLFHTDAAQALGKVPIDVQKLNIDLMSVSAHKLYGPKGIGALFIKRKTPKIKIVPIIDGGGHENGLRSGTLNVPGIVGFGKACEIAKLEMKNEAERTKYLRDKLQNGIMNKLEDVYLNGHPTQRLPNNLNLSFYGVESEAILMGMKEVALSTGSACSSASVEKSHVLKAIGLNDDLISSAIRFGIGRFNTEEEIDYVINRIVEVVNHLRSISPKYKLKKEITKL
ncbi:IscS subfamily cysteine desulfurase [Candidatus Chrysopegis kryptomonas]|uniref:Cysteine desulfurase IscS n=1 Tax=Candidatus Chryseopegocella kryptomonas TaxID=1633643 RepID=A0A0P1MW16_9BACT|nr:IscS subfamily cysteine desulfurase [Candidatus Chrysopegis kryptomonas]CUT00145.1 cysteine desulfurase [Candidatus Chrysopegis kryptomonas]